MPPPALTQSCSLHMQDGRPSHALQTVEAAHLTRMERIHIMAIMVLCFRKIAQLVERNALQQDMREIEAWLHAGGQCQGPTAP